MKLHQSSKELAETVRLRMHSIVLYILASMATLQCSSSRAGDLIPVLFEVNIRNSATWGWQSNNYVYTSDPKYSGLVTAGHWQSEIDLGINSVSGRSFIDVTLENGVLEATWDLDHVANSVNTLSQHDVQAVVGVTIYLPYNHLAEWDVAVEHNGQRPFRLGDWPQSSIPSGTTHYGASDRATGGTQWSGTHSVTYDGNEYWKVFAWELNNNVGGVSWFTRSQHVFAFVTQNWSINFDGHVRLQVVNHDMPTIPDPSSILASLVYHSPYTGTGTPPWNRLDTSKTLAKEGTGSQTLGYDNLINTAQGINGLVFDIQNLPQTGSLNAGDFEFQVSPQGAFDSGANPPANWQSALVPSSITVTTGSPDRILIQWPDHTIMNRWLRVTIKATPNTGLAEPEVYYLGHLLGETTGPADNMFTVSFADITPIRADVGQTVDASSITDIDKNGTVSFADISAMRANVGSQLPQISVP